MASLGQELRRERELRGISLQEIADSTRISMRFLQAIEEDELNLIPGEFFVRAILRSYARSIGIDEHQVLNKYQEMQAFAEQEKVRVREDRMARRPSGQAPSARWMWLAAVAVAICALGFGLYSLFSGAQEPERSALLETTLPSASTPVMSTESPPPAEAAEDIEGLRLDLEFIEETWLHIYADGESTWDGIKTAGESLKVTAGREVLLNVGNAGGFALTINGQKAKPLGPRGAVRTNILITAENFGDFLIADKPDES